MGFQILIEISCHGQLTSIVYDVVLFDPVLVAKGPYLRIYG